MRTHLDDALNLQLVLVDQPERVGADPTERLVPAAGSIMKEGRNKRSASKQPRAPCLRAAQCSAKRLGAGILAGTSLQSFPLQKQDHWLSTKGSKLPSNPLTT